MPEKEIKVNNKKAYFDFKIEDNIESGIVLLGWEVKAVRSGHISIRGAYCSFKPDGLYLVGSTVTPLQQSSSFKEGEDKRDRKLLLNKKELLKLKNFASIEGRSIVPLKVYFNENGWAKILLGKATGKKNHDKRQAIKERDLEIESRREMENY